MKLIDRHGTPIEVLFGSLSHPLLVSPRKIREIRGPRGRARAELRGEAIGVRLIEDFSPLCVDRVLIELTKAHIREKALIDSALLEREHIICLRIPPVSVTDQGDRLRMGGPDGKMHPLPPVQNRGMRAHLPIDTVISAISEEIAVQLRQKYRIQSLCLRRILLLHHILLCSSRLREKGL